MIGFFDSGKKILNSSDPRGASPEKGTPSSAGGVPLRAMAFLALLVLIGAACGSGARGREGRTTMTEGNLSYLALGDSYTIGESVDPGQRWPVLLARAFREAGVPLGEPVIVARTGWTTDELAAAMDEAGLQGRYDLVSLLIGVNNQYRGRSPEEFRLQFRDLLARAVALAGGENERVLVLSIPDWGVTPFARGRDRDRIAREIDAFNRVKMEECWRAAVSWVDVTPISREAEGDPDLVASDGLHPSGLMYARWVQAAFPVALEMLRTPRP